jgi:orotidine-5'-phosphate decarboxylase
VTGWKGGLDSVFSLCQEHNKGILLLVYMSNPGAESFYSMKVNRLSSEHIFEHFAQLGLEWKAQGLIVGATRPEILRRVRTIVGPNMAIFSPGIGPQGGDAKEAIDAGATYLIVGRSIYSSSAPLHAAKTINDLIR